MTFCQWNDPNDSGFDKLMIPPMDQYSRRKQNKGMNHQLPGSGRVARRIETGSPG
jgi:hypothetical protein